MKNSQVHPFFIHFCQNTLLLEARSAICLPQACFRADALFSIFIKMKGYPMSANRADFTTPNKLETDLGVQIERSCESLLANPGAVGFSLTAPRAEGHRTEGASKTGLDPAVKGGLDEDAKLLGKEARKKWKRLRKLNLRFRKKWGKQQRLRADIMRLRHEIFEVKQEIVNCHRELARGK